MNFQERLLVDELIEAAEACSPSEAVAPDYHQRHYRLYRAQESLRAFINQGPAVPLLQAHKLIWEKSGHSNHITWPQYRAERGL